MKEYKNPFCIRHDHLTCPLPLTLESYWTCEADCHHCPGRKLNEVWGKEQRIADPFKVAHKLDLALRALHPATPIARALAAKKTIFIGRKADAYQPIERKSEITRRYIETLNRLEWTHIICSRYTNNMERDVTLFRKGFTTVLIEITVGGEGDWELFERMRTPAISDRLRAAARWRKAGVQVGIRGEPFIPGYHTIQNFRDILTRLKEYGLRSYNIYNLHLNPYNAKRLSGIGLDIEKIWRHNQDRLWKPIQQELCEIADEKGIILGCPDFVNTPPEWRCRANTCCGVTVGNPFRYNTHTFKRLLQNEYSPKEVLRKTWEGIGTPNDRQEGERILKGTSKDHYNMKDAGL